MRNLPAPSRANARQHLIRALAPYQYGGAPKGYPATAAELDSVEQIYDQYDATLATPSPQLQGPTLADALRTGIYDGYRFVHDGARLAEIRAMLLAGVRRCPICGIGTPTELDHFLPRGAFAPLAIYVRNLVPYCHECNNRKNDHVGGPGQGFLHPYFDNLPNEQFLVASINIQNGGLLVDFEIAHPPGVSADLISRLRYQFKRLKLNERYALEVNHYLLSQVASLHQSHHTDQAEGVRSYLLRQGAIESAVLYPNHWRPVLLRALADHDVFCSGGFAQVLPNPEGFGVHEFG